MKREKLLAKARNNPKGLRFADLCKLAEDYGFRFRRQEGSHRIFRRDGVPRRLNFQPGRNGMAKEYQVHQLLELIDEYGEEG
ncbi:MAG: type II toxin-antitoxin system HicA family toxin [Chloroflexia bacterium]|nr:type II toxin-antitoxin system HicA family toxin [Chloroflexia bacterium]